MARSLPRLAYPLLLAAIVICFHWKLVFTDRYTWLNSPDFANQLLPWYQFQASEWHAGRIPLWNPYEWAGQSLIGQAQPGVVDPLNLFLYSMPLTEHGWIAQSALHWFYVLGYVCGALSFYAFARFGLLLSPSASAFAGLAFSLGGVPSSTSWPQMMHATIWGPLALLFQFRAVRGSTPLRDGALSGVFLGTMWLSGHHQIPLYFTLAAIGFWLYFLGTRFLAKPALLKAAILCGIFLFLFGAPQTLPMAEYGKLALRWAGAEAMMGWNDKLPYHVHEQFSANAASLVGIVFNNRVPYSPFMGIAAVALAIGGCAAMWTKRDEVRWMAALGVAAALYGLGSLSFVQGPLYALLPAIEKARVPAVAFVLLNLALAGLAGFGVDALREGARQMKALVLPLLLAGLACAGIAYYQVEVRSWWNWTFLAPALAAPAVAFVLWKNARWSAGILTLVMVSELSLFTPSIWAEKEDTNRERYVERLAGDTDLYMLLRSMGNESRIDATTEDIPFSVGDYWGIESLVALVPSVPATMWNIGPFNPDVRDFLSIRYDVGRKPVRPGQEEIYRSPASGIAVYENRGSFPRGWIVHKVRQVPDLEAAAVWLKTAKENRRTEAVAEAPLPSIETCAPSGESVEFLERVPNRLRLRVRANCRALLVVNDMWDAGWKSPQGKVWRVDGLVRGVMVEKGEQEVEFRYRPTSVIAGFAFFALGLAGIAWVGRWKS